jgi:polyisoprenyl-phosphate glycosyltransferase
MISFVIPALNEEGAIGATLEGLDRVTREAALDGAEILVVDDGSSDRTGEIARAKGARVVSHPHNVGYGRSIKDGIDAATHDTIVILDADGTYPIEEIPRLLAEYRRGFDMVVGARTGAHYRESLLKAPLRVILKWLVEFTVGRRVPDVNSGLRVFSKATVTPFMARLSNTFSFTTSQTLVYMLKGKFVTYLPIGYNERVGNTKVRLLWDSLRTLQYITQAIVYYNPLKMFLLLSLFSLACSVVAFACAWAFALTPVYVLGGAAILAAVILFGMGLVADLLRQIAEQVRESGAQRPK